AVLELPADRIVLQEPDDGTPSFATPSLDDATLSAREDADGAEAVLPVGIVQPRAAADGDRGDANALTLSSLPARASGEAAGALLGLAPSGDDEVGRSAGAAEDLGVGVGDSVTIVGTGYTVASVGDDLWYSHTPVVVMSPDAWSRVSEQIGGTGDPT